MTKQSFNNLGGETLVATQSPQGRHGQAAAWRCRMVTIVRDRQRRLVILHAKRISALLVVSILAITSNLRAQTTVVIEDFEFATSDQAAENGVIDLTDFANTPAFYISGDTPGEGASPAEPNGNYSIGTDAAFCVQFCLPGSRIGFRRYLSATDFPDVCPGSTRHYLPLQYTYGDPQHPGEIAPNFPLDELALLNDVYGDGAFCDGLSWTNYSVSLVDCEGEIFEFANVGEIAMCSTAWTLDLAMGSSFKRLSPESLVEVPNGDRLLTEIAAIDVYIQDENDPPVAIGKWYIDYLRAVEPPAPAIPGDVDQDGDIDLDDFASLADCLHGPNATAPTACTALQLDDDVDIDLHDASAFMKSFGMGQ